MGFLVGVETYSVLRAHLVAVEVFHRCPSGTINQHKALVIARRLCRLSLAGVGVGILALGGFLCEALAESRVPGRIHLIARSRFGWHTILVADSLDHVIFVLHAWLVAVRRV